VTVTSGDLIPGIEINDLRVAPDRTLWIATNNGIYAWRDGQARRHLDAAAGLRNNAVKKVFLDGSGRLWFVTPENVGFYRIEEIRAEGGLIPVTTFELPAANPGALSTTVPEAQITPGISVQGYPEQAAASPDALSGLLETLLGFFRGLFRR
jgi:hypothetical protein